MYLWVEKDFRFEAAHRLMAPYEGLCRSIHGHSFRVKVRLGGRELNDRGMLYDFAEIKPIGGWINEHWDHALLVRHDDADLIDWCKKNGCRHFAFSDNPTSEVIARDLMVLVKQRFPSVEKIMVTVEETCTSRAVLESD